MTVIHVVAYTTFIGCFFCMLKFQSHAVTTMVFSIASFAMSACLTYSMNKINMFARLVANEGIKSSKYLLAVHLTAFWIVSFLQAATFYVTTMIDRMNMEE